MLGTLPVYGSCWQWLRGSTPGWVAYFSSGLSDQGLFGDTICKVFLSFPPLRDLSFPYTPKLKNFLKKAKLGGGRNLTSLNRMSDRGVDVLRETDHLTLHPTLPGIALSSSEHPTPQEMTL